MPRLRTPWLERTGEVRDSAPRTQDFPLGTVRWRPAQATCPPPASLRTPSPLLGTPALGESYHDCGTEPPDFTDAQATGKLPWCLNLE